MMFDVITISDDEEEVQILDHIVNIERRPPVVDLTTTRSKKRTEPEPSESPSSSPPSSPKSPRFNEDPQDQPTQASNSGPFAQAGSQPTSQAPPPPTPQPSPQLPQTSPHRPSQPTQTPPRPPQQQQFYANNQPLFRPSVRSFAPRPPQSHPSPFQPSQFRAAHPPQSHHVRSFAPRPPSSHPPSSEPPQLRVEPNPQPPPTPHVRQLTPQQPTPPTSDYDSMIAKKEMGNKHFRRNAFNEAICFYRQAAELARKLNNRDMSAILHFNLAMAYDKLGAHNQAADECAAAVKLNDKYIKAHVKRAEIFMSQAKFEEAVICYEHVCELDSTKKDDAMRRINLAKELFKTAKKQDQHEILGLRPNFTIEDLRAAYKQKARAHHPDKHSDADVVTRRIHEKIFKDASEAYSFFRKRFG